MIDVAEHDLKTILALLNKYAPECEVRAFGSRVSWTAKEHSDLDLVIVGPDKLKGGRLEDLKEALDESSLPFAVDVMDWHRISSEFHKNITKSFAVIKKPVSAKENGWKYYKVSDFAEVVGGGTPKTEVDEYWNGDIPWITPKDLSSHQGRRIAKGERNISQEGLKNSSARVVPANTVLLTSRAPVGYLAIAQNEVTTNQGFRNLVVKEGFSPEFVYYLLLNNVDYLKQHASGSTFQELSGGTLKNLEFQIPDYATQKKIAKILGALDEKIELNQQMNKTLESVAQTLFKQWFVDFEFPDDSDQPYKSSDGKMMDSELGEIPERWKLGRFSDFVLNMKEPLRSGEELNDRKYVPIESLPLKQIGMIDDKSYLDAQSSLVAFEKNDILFGAMRAYFHRVNFAPYKGVTRTTVFVLRPRKLSYLSYGLFLLNQDSSVHYANLHSKGSTMPYAVWENSLSEMPVVVPDERTLEMYHKLTYPLLERISELSRENKTLVQIRGSLLPKLMSGKVRA